MRVIIVSIKEHGFSQYSHGQRWLLHVTMVRSQSSKKRSALDKFATIGYYYVVLSQVLPFAMV